MSPKDPWAPYRPGPEAPWDVRRVVHLHRRAGFAAPWAVVQRDLRDGPGPNVERLLAGTVNDVPADFGATADLLADAAVAANEPARLKAWWVYRLLRTPDPLGERLTLFWHDAFATSNAKVNDLGAMRRQNDLLRRHARAPFGELLEAVVCDPALLAYLDAPANRKGHPNENLARELMELFTVGLGPFTEADVKEAARVLTGWTVEDGVFQENPARHDDGPKTVLGRTGKWSGKDLLALLQDHPATAARLATRLTGLFFGEGVLSAEAVRSLAEGLRQNRLDVGWAVRTILRSQAFFAAENLGCRVVGPVEFVVGAARALEMQEPPPSTFVLADWVARLGQDLFYPPNVGGWPGGRAWINARAVLGRANYAAAVAGGRDVGRPPLDALGLARRHGRETGPEALVTFYGELLRGQSPGDAERERLRAAGRQSPGDAAENARLTVALLLAGPANQLG